MIVVWMADGLVPAGVIQKALLAAYGAVITLTLLRGGRAAGLFALLALVPWVGAVAASALLDRPLVLERCFVFAHVGLLGLWGVAWQALPWQGLRLAFLWLVASTTLGGLCDFVAGVPREPPAWAVTADALRGRVSAADVVFLDDYRDLNRFRYYTTQAGLPWLRALARVPDAGAGHVVHRAAISDDEILPDNPSIQGLTPGRIWQVADNAVWATLPVPGKSVRWQQKFESGGAVLIAVLYE
jgi:hypothetical protein